MYTLLKISDLIANGPSPELAPFIGNVSHDSIRLRWLGGMYLLGHNDALLLSKDGLPHSCIQGNTVHHFKRRGMRFTIDIELDEAANFPYVDRVNLVLANLLAEQMTGGTVGLSQGSYTYGILSYGEIFPTTAKIAIRHYSEAP